MSRSDRYAALFFLALAGYICQQSMGIGVGTLSRPGPGLMSFGAGAAVALLSLACLIQTFFARKADEAPGEPAGRKQFFKVAAISLSLFLYTIAVNWLGFLLATLVFVLFIFRIVETESWWRSTGKSILVTAGTYLLFVVWMGINLPTGFLPW